MSEDAVDPELLGQFIDESLDHLREIPNLFIDLEEHPENTDLVNGIFRPVHTIKGSASFFGVMKVQKLAHVTETVMDLVRKNVLRADKKVIDGVLEAIEVLISMFESLREGGPEVCDGPVYERAFVVVDELAKGPTGIEKDLEDLAQLLERVLDSGSVELVPQALELVRRNMPNAEPEVEMVMSEESLKLFATMDELLLKGVTEIVDADVQKMEATLSGLAQSCESEEGKKSVAELKEQWDAVVPVLGFEPLIRDVLIEHLPGLRAFFKEEPQSSAEPSGEPPVAVEGKETETPKKAAPAMQSVKTMRVSEEAIDNFLAYVGELIVTRYKFEHLRRQFALQRDREFILEQFRKLNESFTSLAEDIERSIMNIRRVQVKTLTQKVPKIIRDIADATGKKIEVKVEGESLEIDKSLVDVLEGPLVHMIRNAADHGIEMPEARISSGKSEKGHITLKFVDEEETIRMVIQDDGKGLDLEKLKAKAVSLGLIGPEDPLTEDDVVNLLFMSGVSTAEKVTDVSGRGVGMDVVKQNVTNNGGIINVSSQPGQGSIFSVELPKSVTTQIMQGFIVQASDELYVLPLKNIVDVIRAKKDLFVASELEGECVKRKKSDVLRLLRLSEVYLAEKKPMIKRGFEGSLITLENGDESMCVFVDVVKGIQQVVVKPIEERVVQNHLFSGAADLGDGTVALVVDVESLFEMKVMSTLFRDEEQTQPIGKRMET